MDAKMFSSIKKSRKKYKKSNAISFESVPLDTKIDVFSVKKRAYFFRISSYTYISPKTSPKKLEKTLI